MSDLTNAAKSMLLGPLLTARHTLRYANVENVASAEAADALRELLEAGLAQVSVEPNGAETWTLTPAGASVNRGDLVEGNILEWLRMHARFPLAVAKDGSRARIALNLEADT